MTTDDPRSKPSRRHDLDALRAIAMLLGIVIHAAATVAFPQRPEQMHEFDVAEKIINMIHGFRMPLFFMVSGFFTAMLWRMRGLRALAWHRFRRIFLPFVLGMVAIVPPLMVAKKMLSEEREAERTRHMAEATAPASIWAAAAEGDIEAMQAHLAAGHRLDESDPMLRCPPLVWAAARGQVDAMTWLLDQGVDVSTEWVEGNTALHLAAFFGQPRVVARLLDRGADAAAEHTNGLTALAMVELPAGEELDFVAGLFGVEREREDMLRGRAEAAEILRPHSPPPTPADDGVVRETLGSISPVHLWFLWYLCWLVVGFVVVAWILQRWRVPLPPAGLVLSPARYLWLVPLTILPQLLMRSSLLFGPDTPDDLLIDPTVLAYYAIFFGFGALYYAYDDPDGRISQWWRLALLLGLAVVLPLGLWLQASEPREHWLLYCGLQVTYAWLMIFGAMGLFRRYFGRERRRMRYISDSSYFLYLAHPLLLVGLEFVIRSWPIPWSVKLVIYCVVTTAILPVVYDKLVRYRWLGRLLNGPRTRPASP